MDTPLSPELSHLSPSGRARMVDVGGKPAQKRYAAASGRIRLSPRTLDLVRRNLLKKGDVLSVAQIAGIQAAKHTADIIPLCHPLPLDHIEVSFSFLEDGILAESSVRCTGRTGVEMEALTAVSAALLSIYDMCKAADKDMVIEEIKLVEKVKQDA